MKIKLERAWKTDISKYKNILDKYNAEYIEYDRIFEMKYALIEIEEANELFVLAKELGYSLIISDCADEETVTIYDGFIE